MNGIGKKGRRGFMPEISRFYGMVITINFNDHVPPHFHVGYGEFLAIVDIVSGHVLRGNLPANADRMIREWTVIHRAELMEDWERARQGQKPFAIKPLE